MIARLAVYAVIILSVVAIALNVLTSEPPAGRAFPGASATPARPTKPWIATEALAEAANADFVVLTDRPDNVRRAGTAVGSDWPQFNGARRDNRSDDTGLLTNWPPEGPPLAWTAQGLGAGYSSVAVVQGVVYTLGNKGESEAMMALDVGTGEKLWSTPFAWASHPSSGDGPRGTPTVYQGRVFGLGANGDLVCVDAADGKIRWQRNLLHDFGGQGLGWGICESPLIENGRLIATPGGDQATLVALDPETGKLVWKSLLNEKDGASYASPAFAEIGGVRQIIQFTAKGTVGVRADTGKFLWRENSASSGMANCSSPLVAGEFVFSASNYGTGGALVRLTAQRRGIDAKLVYKTADMANHHGDMVIADGFVYGSHDPGVLTCLDLSNGDVKWKHRSVGKGAVTYADGRIYLRGEQGAVALVEATGAEYRELGQFDQPHRSQAASWSHPVIAAGRLFLRDQGTLLCYDLKATE